MKTPKHKLCNICILAATIIVWNNFYPVEQISVPYLFVVTVTQSKCDYFSSSLSSRWSCDQSSVLHRRVVFASMAIWIWTLMVTEMGALCVKYSRPGRSEWVNGWMNEATVCWHTHTLFCPSYVSLALTLRKWVQLPVWCKQQKPKYESLCWLRLKQCFSILGLWPHKGSPGIQMGSPEYLMIKRVINIFFQLNIILFLNY